MFNQQREAIAKCLGVMLTLSREEYEQLPVDNWLKLFGNWKARELRLLQKLYKDEELFMKEGE